MKFIFGRFVDCFLLWIQELFYFGDDAPSNFWQCLSLNTTHDNYFIVFGTTLFGDKDHAITWSIYLDAAWDAFDERLLQEAEND